MLHQSRQSSFGRGAPAMRRRVSVTLPPLRGAVSGPVGARSASRKQVLLGVAAVLVLLVGFGVYLGVKPPSPEHVLVVISEKTSRAPGQLDPLIRARVHEMSAQGPARLIPFAVGETSAAVRPVDLAVLRDGEPVNDPDLRRAAIDKRLAAIVTGLAAAPVGREGFSLVAALQAADAESSRRPDQRLEVWLQTTVLASSSDPLRVAALIAADPKAAVQEVLAKSQLGKLDLSRVDLHPILLQPVGPDQPALSVAAEAWRSEFITELGTALGASVHTPRRSGAAVEPAWGVASTVPPIVFLRDDPTPVLTPDPDGRTPEVIDTAGFVPNTATLLAPDAIHTKIARVSARYEQANGAYMIQIKGFTAAFGDRQSCIALSRDRAGVIGDLLSAEGVPAGDIDAIGVGFDERADPTQHPQSAAQRVVIIRLIPRST